jgi:hypothetical protein
MRLFRSSERSGFTGLLSFSVAAALSAGAHGALVEYRFNNSNDFSPTLVGADVTASNVAPRPADTTNGLGGNLSTESDGVGFRLDFSPAGNTSVSEAVAEEAYFSFTLTAAAGKTLDLDGFSFRARGGGSTNTTRSVFVRTSADDFTANVFSTPTLPSSLSPLAAYSHTFTSIPELSAVTFRFYAINSGGTFSRSVEVDDIVVGGTVVPEPVSLGLLGIAGLLSMRRRR